MTSKCQYIVSEVDHMLKITRVVHRVCNAPATHIVEHSHFDRYVCGAHLEQWKQRYSYLNVKEIKANERL